MSRRAASAGRVGGDRQQHLVAWVEALLAVRDRNVATVAVEAVDAGVCDDVVVTYEQLPPRYLQVKFGVDARQSVGTDFLLAGRGAQQQSLLRRLYDTWLDLSADGRVADLELVTSQQLDPGSPLLRVRDSITERVMPALADESDQSGAGQEARAWAEHLGIDRDVLHTFLESLRFRSGISHAAVRTRARDVMAGLGLQTHDGAVEAAVGCVGSWVADGRRTLSVPEIEEEIERLQLAESDPATLLVVSAIDQYPSADVADVVLDWTPHYPTGVAPMARRAPVNDGAWARMQSDLDDAVRRCEMLGPRHVVATGAMRLPAWFAAGAAFRHVGGWRVTCGRDTQRWSSDDPADHAFQMTREEHDLPGGGDLAVAVGVSLDPSRDVLDYLDHADLDVAGLITFLPAHGATDQALQSGGQAVAAAQQIREALRRELGERGQRTIHLFLAVPAGLALLLGHRWNRLAPTVTYEDLGPGSGYISGFQVEA